MMEQEQIFGMALGLGTPWYVSKIEFKDHEEIAGEKEFSKIRKESFHLELNLVNQSNMKRQI